MSNRLKVYMSHSIRGILGAKATKESMAANNEAAIAFGTELRGHFPEDIDLYVPGDHDEFVSIAFQEGIMTDTQILNVDCHIIDERDVVLAWIPDQHVSNGMLVEAVHAVKTGRPVLLAKTIDQAVELINVELMRRKS